MFLNVFQSFLIGNEPHNNLYVKLGKPLERQFRNISMVALMLFSETA